MAVCKIFVREGWSSSINASVNTSENPEEMAMECQKHAFDLVEQCCEGGSNRRALWIAMDAVALEAGEAGHLQKLSYFSYFC